MDPAAQRRLKNGGALFLISSVLLALLVGLPRLISFGLVLGTILTLAAAAGLLWAMGALVPRPRPEPPPRENQPDETSATPSEEALPAEPPARRWWKSLDLWVVLTGALLYLPQLGAGGLWDPWETHYGEVARRMLEQDDWISMWWQNEWFFSKPVLIMWIDGIGMALVGGNPFPDGELFGAAWGMRLPVTALAIFCMWAVYHFVAQRFNPRAGFVAAIALGTMPTYAFLAHQTMTDMPYVATMSAGMCFLALALELDDSQVAR